MCPICRHAKRLKIEAAIVAGGSLRDIGRQFGISKDTVAQHKNVCLKEAIREVQQEQQHTTGNEVLDRLARDARLIDEALGQVWSDTTKDVELLLKVLGESRQQNRLRAELLRDRELEQLQERLAEMEQQLETLLARKSA